MARRRTKTSEEFAKKIVSSLPNETENVKTKPIKKSKEIM